MYFLAITTFETSRFSEWYVVAHIVAVLSTRFSTWFCFVIPAKTVAEKVLHLAAKFLRERNIVLAKFYANISHSVFKMQIIRLQHHLRIDVIFRSASVTERLFSIGGEKSSRSVHILLLTDCSKLFLKYSLCLWNGYGCMWQRAGRDYCSGNIRMACRLVQCWSPRGSLKRPLKPVHIALIRQQKSWTSKWQQFCSEVFDFGHCRNRCVWKEWALESMKKLLWGFRYSSNHFSMRFHHIQWSNKLMGWQS